MIKKLQTHFFIHYRCTAIPLTARQATNNGFQPIALPPLGLENAEFVGNKQASFIKWLEHKHNQAEPQTQLLIQKAIEDISQFLSSQKNANNQMKKEQALKILQLPLAKQFKLIKKFDNGGFVKQHKLVDTKAEDFIDNHDAAHVLAEQGYKVEILPIIDRAEKEARTLIFPNLSSKTSNPDLKVNDFYIDVKRPKEYKNIVRLANTASVQGATALIKDSKMEFDEDIILRRAEAIFKEKTYNSNQVYFISKGKLYKFKKR